MSALPPPVPAPAPRRTSLVGPVLLTSAGALALVAALVLTVLTATGFLGAVQTDVLTRDGEPGPAVLAWTAAPGAVEVDLVRGERYAVHLVVDADDVTDGERPRLAQDVLLETPSGAVVAADDPPGVTTSSGAGGRLAASQGAFTAPETGTYTMAAPPTDHDDAWVAVTLDTPFLPFFTAIWQTVLGVFLVAALVLVGGGLLVGGIVWWVLRSRARRAAGVAGPSAAPPSGPAPGTV